MNFNIELDCAQGISVQEACEMMKVRRLNGEVVSMSPQTLQAGLIQRVFPFGVGFKGSGKTYYYYIHRGLFEQFLEGKLPFGVVGGSLYGND